MVMVNSERPSRYRPRATNPAHRIAQQSSNLRLTKTVLLNNDSVVITVWGVNLLGCLVAPRNTTRLCIRLKSAVCCLLLVMLMTHTALCSGYIFTVRRNTRFIHAASISHGRADTLGSIIHSGNWSPIEVAEKHCLRHRDDEVIEIE